MQINENPIAERQDGTLVYDNAPTVVVVLVRSERDEGVVAIRRNNEPGKGKISLPGGYQMRGETWQEAAARELFEETGFVCNPDHIVCIAEPVTDEYQNNLMFVSYLANEANGEDMMVHDSTFVVPKDEVQEVLNLQDAGNPEDWAFPKHYEAAKQAIFNMHEADRAREELLAAYKVDENSDQGKLGGLLNAMLEAAKQK